MKFKPCWGDFHEVLSPIFSEKYRILSTYIQEFFAVIVNKNAEQAG